MVELMESKQHRKHLVDRVKAGDREAFEQLFSEFRTRLQSWIEIRLGDALRRKVETDDVLQESFLHALRSVSRFEWRGEESFLYWLSRIAERVILVQADGFKRARQTSLEVELSDVALSQSKALRREERFDRLQRAIEDLEPDHRQVILLSRLEGLALKEVAQRMQRTPNAVSHLLIRALRKLKDIFGDTESLQLPPRSLDPGEVQRDE